jgi:hypothetical protein
MNPNCCQAYFLFGLTIIIATGCATSPTRGRTGGDLYVKFDGDYVPEQVYVTGSDGRTRGFSSCKDLGRQIVFRK